MLPTWTQARSTVVKGDEHLDWSKSETCMELCFRFCMIIYISLPLGPIHRPFSPSTKELGHVDQFFAFKAISDKFAGRIISNKGTNTLLLRWDCSLSIGLIWHQICRKKSLPKWDFSISVSIFFSEKSFEGLKSLFKCFLRNLFQK